jgi:ubiquinone biosynthesis protein
MLPKKLIPTRLIDPSAREEIQIVEPEPPSRLRFLRIVRSLLWLLLLGLWYSWRGERAYAVFARRVRTFMEEMGGIWIKFGQLLATRRDILPAAFCSELAELHDRVIGFPPEMSRQIIERELGAPVDKLFAFFEAKPFAAASIGQIHRALLRKERVWVAVKVRRPYIEQLFARDLASIRFIIGFFQRFKILLHLRWDELLWELREIMLEEVDYRIEASAMTRMRRSLRRHKIYVPKVYPCSTDRVLVMEFVQGVLMSDYRKVLDAAPEKVAAWRAENNVEPHLLGRRLFLSYLRSVFEDNLFHGDLHPGNIVLLRDSRIAFIDFGTVSSLEREFLQKFALYMQCLANREYSRAVDLLFLLIGSLPVVDLGEVKDKLIQRLRAWELRNFTKGLPFREKSVATLLAELLKVMFHYKITMQWAFMRVERTDMTLNASLQFLYPEANYTQLMRVYFRQARRRLFRKMLSTDALLSQVTGLQAAFMELPGRAFEYMMFQTHILRRHSLLFQGSTSKIAHFFSVIFGKIAFAFLLTTLLMFLAFLHQHHPTLVEPIVQGKIDGLVRIFPVFDYQVWLLLLVVVFYFYRVFNNLKKRFAQPEVRIAEGVVNI